MNPINVFWIEDNPIIENFDIIDGIKFPSFETTLCDKQHFKFHILQHPVEIYEYLHMLDYLKKNLKHNSLEKFDECLPDLIVFDYKLSDNLNATNPNSLQYTFEPHLDFIKSHSPSYLLKQKYPDLFSDYQLFMEREDVLSGNYSAKHFFENADMEGSDTIDDEFGLYCGLTLLKELKDIPILGIPATLSKANRKSMTHNSQFYEWLNSYDLKKPISRSNRESKNWDEILSLALPEFREKIKEYIKNDSIYVLQNDVFNLLRNVETLDKNSKLIYSGFYGEKLFYIEGLFCEIADLDKRKKEITEWLSSINEYYTEIESIKPKFETLWNCYVTKFSTRILISNYTLHPPSDEGDSVNYAACNELKQQFISNGRIKSEQEMSFDKVLADHSGNISSSRLLILMLCTKLFIGHQNSILSNPLNSESEQANLFLEEDDYYNVLYPFANSNAAGNYNPLLLMVHENQTPTTYYANFYNRLSQLNIPGNKKWVNIGDWITQKEKNLLLSFFSTELAEIEKPNWLN